MVEIDSRIILTQDKISSWKSSATRDRHMREDPVGWYNTMYSCHCCGRYQDRPIEREEHYKSSHGGAKFVEEWAKWSYAEWACHICGDHCDSLEKRTAHYKRYHPHDRVKWNQGQPADAHQIRYLFKPEERPKIPVRNPVQDIGQQGPAQIIDMRNLDSESEEEEEEVIDTAVIDLDEFDSSVVAVGNPVDAVANTGKKAIGLWRENLQRFAPANQAGHEDIDELASSVGLASAPTPAPAVKKQLGNTETIPSRVTKPAAMLLDHLLLDPPLTTWHARQAQYQFPTSPPEVGGVPPEGEHVDEKEPTPMPIDDPSSTSTVARPVHHMVVDSGTVVKPIPAQIEAPTIVAARPAKDRLFISVPRKAAKPISRHGPASPPATPPVTPTMAIPVSMCGSASPTASRGKKRSAEGSGPGPASPEKKRSLDAGEHPCEPSSRSGPSTPSSPKKRKLTVPSGCTVGRQQALERFLRLAGSAGKSLSALSSSMADGTLVQEHGDNIDDNAADLSQRSVEGMKDKVQKLCSLGFPITDLVQAATIFNAAVAQIEAIAKMASKDHHIMSVREARFLEKKEALNNRAVRLRQELEELQEKEKGMKEWQAQLVAKELELESLQEKEKELNERQAHLDAKELELDDREIDIDIKVTAKDDLDEIVDNISVDVDKVLGNGDQRRRRD